MMLIGLVVGSFQFGLLGFAGAHMSAMNRVYVAGRTETGLEEVV